MLGRWGSVGSGESTGRLMLEIGEAAVLMIMKMRFMIMNMVVTMMKLVIMMTMMMMTGGVEVGVWGGGNPRESGDD